MKTIPYILYLLLIGSHQVIWRDVTSVWGVSINLAGLMVLTTALYKSELATLWFGFFAGLVMAAGMPSNMGWHALTLAALGVTACHVRERLNMDSLWAKLLLVVAGIFLHNVAVILITQASGFLYLLWATAIPDTIYSGLLVWVFFMVKEGHVTMKKIRTIF